MPESTKLLEALSQSFKDEFRGKKVILSFAEYLEMLERQPKMLIRSAAAYLKDTFDYFGKVKVGGPGNSSNRYRLFDEGSEISGPIIGCEAVQEEIYRILSSFVRQGHSSKLILLHGPNGSAKTSTLEAISRAMARYSESDEGVVYTFNWIFPTEKSANPRTGGETGPIGFAGTYESRDDVRKDSYAHLDESKVACKLLSEFRDNPIFLIPRADRERLLRQWIATKEGIDPDAVELPPHILRPGLSKKNQLILDNLLTAYEGDFGKVMRHVQVERFFYSRQYRVGIATVEPQMSIDAAEKQLTMDKNIANLPSFLHNIRFHEAFGQLVEANRGMLEFSDMLKRPLEAFKYLLTTVEKGTLSLPSSTANLDIVFFGTTNEKHLDAFKTMPDFSSFRSRFELITVPYLLEPQKEVKIYQSDLTALAKSKKIAPHAASSLCMWAVMTRLKQPDPEHYDSKYRALIARLDPRSKVALYEGGSLQPAYKAAEEVILRDLRAQVYNESQGVAIYEGRFGASPREVRGILHRAAESTKYKTLMPMAVFDELRRLVRDKTVYEFLQFEPRGKYHDAEKFIEIIEQDFCEAFEHEVLLSMTLVAEGQYDLHLSNYVDNVVAFVKKEKIYQSATGSYEPPSEALMKEVEKIIGVTGSIDRHRQNILGRIAAYKIDHPDRPIDVKVIFHDLLKKIQDHYHNEKRQIVEENFKFMLQLGTENERNLKVDQVADARRTYQELEKRFGYDEYSARESLKFLMARRKAASK